MTGGEEGCTHECTAVSHAVNDLSWVLWNPAGKEEAAARIGSHEPGRADQGHGPSRAGGMSGRGCCMAPH